MADKIVFQSGVSGTDIITYERVKAVEGVSQASLVAQIQEHVDAIKLLESKLEALKQFEASPDKEAEVVLTEASSSIVDQVVVDNLTAEAISGSVTEVKLPK